MWQVSSVKTITQAPKFLRACLAAEVGLTPISVRLPVKSEVRRDSKAPYDRDIATTSAFEARRCGSW